MTTRLGGFGVPGSGALEQTFHRELLWGGDLAKGMARWQNGVVSGTTRDAGNTPTTVLRAGLILGLVTASSEHAQWDADASDGTQNIAGILDLEIKAQDFDANDADRVVRILKSAPVKASQLLIQGVALVGHADEYLARRQLVAAGFQLDDDPFGYKAGRGDRMVTTSGAVAVIADQNGTTFFGNGADFSPTLPAIKPGLKYHFAMHSDHNLVVASAEGDNIIVIGDNAADSLTFDNPGEKIGAQVIVSSHYVDATLKWLAQFPSPQGASTSFVDIAT